MLEFLKLLFFTKVVLLTPVPVSFDSHYTITPQESINAINPRGHIEIDVTAMIPNGIQSNTNEKLNLLAKSFPENSIKVELINTKTGNTVNLTRVSQATGKEQLLVYVMSYSGVPTDMEFDEIHIKTLVPLSKVSVYWKNGMM